MNDKAVIFFGITAFRTIDYFPVMIFFNIFFSIERFSYTLIPPLPVGACANRPTLTVDSTGR